MGHGSTVLDAIERDAHRIVGMICSERVPEPDVQSAITSLRRRVAETFPERPTLFDETYGRRFARLRTRFRAAPGLFAV
jgi:hypothetical protein